MTAGRLQLCQSDLLAASNPVGRICRRGIAWYAACARRRKERRQLSEMDVRLLKDIGVSRIDAMREANRPFWK